MSAITQAANFLVSASNLLTLDADTITTLFDHLTISQIIAILTNFIPEPMNPKDRTLFERSRNLILKQFSNKNFFSF